MEKILSYQTLQGWYDIDSANVFNLLHTTEKWLSTHRARQLHLQKILNKPIIHHVSQEVDHLREMHVHGVCRSIKLASLRDASEDIRIPNIEQLFCMHIEEDCGQEVRELVLRYDQNLLIDSIFISLQNVLLFYCQPFHNSTSVEHRGLDCQVAYTIANQEIMPQAHNIWGKYP
jgi:hypothetical protein